MSNFLNAPVGSKVITNNGSEYIVIPPTEWSGTVRKTPCIYGRSPTGWQSWNLQGLAFPIDEDTTHDICRVIAALDLTAPLEDIEGNPVKLLSAEAGGEYPLVVLLPAGVVAQYNTFGMPAVVSRKGLCNAKAQPKEITRYVNLYAGSQGDPWTGIYSTKENADLAAKGLNSKRLARKCIVITEGEFDD